MDRRAVLAEQHDECAEGRRYLGLDVLAKSQTVDTTADEPDDAGAVGDCEAAARRMTSFSCSSDRFHFQASDS